jgi:hypothetical protein
MRGQAKIFEIPNFEKSAVGFDRIRPDRLARNHSITSKVRGLKIRPPIAFG